MTPRAPSPAADPLEGQLRALGAAAFPPTPAIARSVSERIAREAVRPSRWPELDGVFRLDALVRPTAAGPRLRRSVALALFALLVLAGVVVAGTLGLGPLRILFVEELPSVPPTAATPSGAPAGGALRLGRPVTTAEAQEALGDGAQLSGPQRARPPDAVWLDERPAAPSVALVWRSGADLPPLEPTGDVGLLMTQVRGTVTGDLVKKLMDSSTDVERTTVGGGEALWVHGGRHALLYLDPRGIVVEENIRLVGDVLIWQRGGVLYRLESNLGLDETRALAESVP